jgi:hypothetical protein
VAAVSAVAASAAAQLIEAAPCAAELLRIAAERSFDAAQSSAALTAAVAITPAPATPTTNTAEAAAITAAAFIAAALRW